AIVTVLSGDLAGSRAVFDGTGVVLRQVGSSLDERTFAVIMNHSYATDGEQLRALLETPVPYIGVLGPRSRTERLLHEIEGADGIERVFAPAGLDVGAEGPQEIASAIVSEIIAVDRGRSGGSLRDRTASIHADRPANIRS